MGQFEKKEGALLLRCMDQRGETTIDGDSSRIGSCSRGRLSASRTVYAFCDVDEERRFTRVEPERAFM